MKEKLHQNSEMIRLWTQVIVRVLFLLAVLAIAILARYSFHMVGAWRWIFVVTAVTALYLNVFVLIVQLFLKVSFLQPLAPTQSEPPFLIAQIAALLAFIYLGYAGIRRFHPQTA